MFDILKSALEFVDNMRIDAYIAEKNIKDEWEALRHRNKQLTDRQLAQLEKWAKED